MDEFPFVVAGIVVGLIILGILIFVAIRTRKVNKPGEINYRAFFILGVIFLPLGIIYEITIFVTGNTAFLVLGLGFIGLGLSYLAIGLRNRDKWKKL